MGAASADFRRVRPRRCAHPERNIGAGRRPRTRAAARIHAGCPDGLLPGLALRTGDACASSARRPRSSATRRSSGICCVEASRARQTERRSCPMAWIPRRSARRRHSGRRRRRTGGRPARWPDVGQARDRGDAEPRARVPSRGGGRRSRRVIGWPHTRPTCASPHACSSRAVSDAVLYRWLRTARVVVTLAGERGSGSQVTEARAAGASVVASDLPIHREAAERPGGESRDLRCAEGIAAGRGGRDRRGRSRVRPLQRARARVAAPSWQSVVDSTLTLYDS